MDKKDEVLSTNETGNELDPGIQELADLADKMGNIESSNEFNEDGFNADGIHRKTGTKYDLEGYDADGFDDIGVDREGFDREGFGSDDRDREGYDRQGYDENGFNRNGFNQTGINRMTGSRYDYDGFDIDGRDRHGYDRDGFNKYGYDIRGFDREGFDGRGFNREGINKKTGTEFGLSGWNQSETIHRDTGTKYDPDGFDHLGYDKDGYDRDGYKAVYDESKKGRHSLFGEYKGSYDRNGYDKDGFDINRFNREGIHEKTGSRFDENGFDAQGKHESTNDIYDSEGYDRTGYNKDGFDRAGFDRSGIHKDTGTKYDPDGYNKDGIDENFRDREGFRLYKNGDTLEQHSPYNKDGFDREGFNRSGFDREGFDREGFDRDGYNREGLDKDGNTREFNAKFNKYGVDENGYTKDGELDIDVEFAIDFAGSGLKDQNKYAAEKGMNEADVRKRLETARKKCPNIDEVIKNILLTGNKMRMAAIANDCEKFIGGELNANEFWDKHPRLNVAEMLSKFINDPDKKKQFSDRIIENLALNSENIEGNLRIFGKSMYDVLGALKGVDDFKKIYIGFSVDGSSGQIRQKRENTKKIYDIAKYIGRYKNQNLDSLLGSRQSFDGGRTWVEFTGETIGKAMDALKKDKKLVCVQTVKDYIINQSKL